jgi:teichuronic acid biosynthesis glycosyltransferase TuaG
MNEPNVSILIPLYNGIEFMDECINSIKAQTYKNWQVIIGINGHPVNSGVYNRAKLYESDKIIVKEYLTLGKPNTLNEMVKDSKYDIICLLDIDDYWHPTKLQAQIDVKCYWDIIGTQCYYVKQNNGSRPTFKVSTQIPKIPLGIVTSITDVNPMINSSVMMNKRDAWWDNIFGVEDYDCWFRLFAAGKTFYNVDRPLVYHRIHNKSHFNGKNNNYVKDLKKKWGY